MNNYATKTRKILTDSKAFVEGGHFICASGRHADFYVNKDALYTYPKKLDDICVMLTDLAISTFTNFDIILAPAVAGTVLGQNIAYNISLEHNKNIRFAYADKQHNTRTIRRGYQDLIKNKRVLLVDDIVSTGNTLIYMAEAVTNLGGIPVGAVAICDRGKVRSIKYKRADKEIFSELTIAALVELDLQTFPKDNCPLCKSGRPLDTTLGEADVQDLIDSLGKVQSSLQSCSTSTLNSYPILGL